MSDERALDTKHVWPAILEGLRYARWVRAQDARLAVVIHLSFVVDDTTTRPLGVIHFEETDESLIPRFLPSSEMVP